MGIFHPENQYLGIMHRILDEGHSKDDRTGVGCRSTWGTQMRFDLQEGFPLFTTRFIGFRIAFEETMFFLRGETDTKKLEEKKIGIWKGNTTREFLDNRGLQHLPEGDMGKGYGWQIRNFGGEDGKPGFDQLKHLIENIKSKPNDRRHYMNYWNPQQVLNEAALPPCHLSYNCQVEDDKLNACFYMRSSDWYHGCPYNVAGYSLLTHLIAKLTGYKPGTLVMMAADTHLYTSQFEVAKEQLTRTPKPFPQFRFKKDFSTLEEALQLEFEDVEVVGYEHCGKLQKIDMAV